MLEIDWKTNFKQQSQLTMSNFKIYVDPSLINFTHDFLLLLYKAFFYIFEQKVLDIKVTNINFDNSAFEVIIYCQLKFKNNLKPTVW